MESSAFWFSIASVSRSSAWCLCTACSARPCSARPGPWRKPTSWHALGYRGMVYGALPMARHGIPRSCLDSTRRGIPLCGLSWQMPWCTIARTVVAALGHTMQWCGMLRSANAGGAVHLMPAVNRQPGDRGGDSPSMSIFLSFQNDFVHKTVPETRSSRRQALFKTRGDEPRPSEHGDTAGKPSDRRPPKKSIEQDWGSRDVHVMLVKAWFC